MISSRYDIHSKRALKIFLELIRSSNDYKITWKLKNIISGEDFIQNGLLNTNIRIQIQAKHGRDIHGTLLFKLPAGEVFLFLKPRSIHDKVNGRSAAQA